MRKVYVALLVLCLALVGGCDDYFGNSSDDERDDLMAAYIIATQGDAFSVSGTAAFPDKSGVYELIFDESSDSVVSGTFTYDGSEYAIVGTYNAATGVIAATAGSSDFTIAGTYVAGAGFIGTITRASDSAVGAMTGLDNSSAAVENYLGTFDGTINGQWNFAISGDKLEGTYSSAMYSGKLSGTVTGNTFASTVFYVYNAPDYVDITMAGITATVTGTISDDGSTIAGTWSWTGAQNANGTFSGTIQ